jgi:hypothetical protein
VVNSLDKLRNGAQEEEDAAVNATQDLRKTMLMNSNQIFKGTKALYGVRNGIHWIGN